eukprot:gene14584-20632_t
MLIMQKHGDSEDLFGPLPMVADFPEGLRPVLGGTHVNGQRLPIQYTPRFGQQAELFLNARFGHTRPQKQVEMMHIGSSMDHAGEAS